MSLLASIRKRRQLTIPDTITRNASWSDEGNVVRISLEGNKKIIIEPYREEKKVDWKKLRAQLRRVANYRGSRGNLSQFIADDRYRH